MAAEYRGLSFIQLRQILYYIYYGPDYPAEEAYKFIIPLMRNYESPLQATGKDTFIQYFIERDERITQDYTSYDENKVMKLAHCLVRFVGVEAELWAKAFHHLTKRKDIGEIVWGVCEGQLLENIGDILPKEVEYYGQGSSIAFDIRFMIQYYESLKMPWSALEQVSIAPGEIFKED